MESLALLVLALMLGMLGSSLAAFVTSVRARQGSTRIVAVLLGVPGALIGTMFIASTNTIFGRVLGVLGLAGLISAAYRLARAPRDLVQD